MTLASTTTSITTTTDGDDDTDDNGSDDDVDAIPTSGDIPNEENDNGCGC